MSSPPAAPSDEPGDEETLIFQWRGRPRKARRLGIILSGSLLAHAATFYLLQVAYTPTASLQPPTAQVVLIAPEDPAQKAAFDQWLLTADPALMTVSPAAGSAGVLNKIGLRYRPSYSGVPPGFRSLDPAPPDADIAGPERSRPPGPVPLAPDELSAPSGPRPDHLPSATTKLVFRGPVEQLAPTQLPPWKFTASQAGRPLEPTVYLVGVRPEGSSPWLFRQPAGGESTIGDAALDEAARAYLARLAFQSPKTPSPGGGVVWGWATFYWGREVYR